MPELHGAKIAIGGKGGVGKTTVSAILAQLFAEAGYDVLAIDADPDVNLASAFGLFLRLIPACVRGPPACFVAGRPDSVLCRPADSRRAGCRDCPLYSPSDLQLTQAFQL